MPYQLIPQLCSLGSNAPDVGEQLEHGHVLAHVVQLAEVSALHDLHNLVGHFVSNAWDLTCLLSRDRKHTNVH